MAKKNISKYPSGITVMHTFNTDKPFESLKKIVDRLSKQIENDKIRTKKEE